MGDALKSILKNLRFVHGVILFNCGNKRTTLSIATFLFSVISLCAQTSPKPVKIDTMISASRKCNSCPVLRDTVIFKRLKCGLYLSSKGDIGYRTEEEYIDNFDRRTRYITWIYGGEENDTINAGMKEMKHVIDTSSFRFLSFLYWSDKNNIYGFNPMSDGGTVYLNEKIDRRTFVVLGDAGYARDKRNIYYRGMIIKGAELKSFRIIKRKGIPELARDKNYFYQAGERMTVEEVKELNLDTP